MRPASSRLGSPNSGQTPTVGTPRRADSNPSARGSLASLISWRALVMVGVLGLVFALVTPSVRVFLGQRAEVAALQEERDAAQTEVDNLNAQIARWDDPAFVMAQARERLAYVMPGETPYRVVDPELASPAAQGSIESLRDGTEPSADLAWYDRMWDEIESTGGVAAVASTGAQAVPATQAP